ncbi:MAG: tetratricopeptide repeat protein [Acidobacteriota bacterium]|nr:tetratricopeptide repeat protein [Acidobacteriota bacterium]
MRLRNIAIFSAAAAAGMIAGSAVGPRPAQAVARELIELQRDVSTLLQGQKDLQSQMTQDHTVMKTLVEQSSDNVGRLNSTMSSLQKSVQDVQANSGARLDTMSTQVQGLSDNLEEIKSRLGKLNQQLVDLQNTMQSVDAKISGGAAPPTTSSSPNGSASYNGNSGAGTSSTGFPTTYASNGSVSPGAVSPSTSAPPVAAGSAPSADTLYSNGLRDITSGKYDLARSEFQDYLRFYGTTDLASNAQFYLGEIAYSQKNYDLAVSEYDKVLTSYPRSFKTAPARLKKALANIELNQKATGVRELREVIKKYPGTEEDRRARAKLKEMGASLSASQ